jgi:hypothetical protein
VAQLLPVGANNCNEFGGRAGDGATHAVTFDVDPG